MVIADAVLTFIASTLLGAFAAALLFEERQNIAGIAAVLIGLSALILLLPVQARGLPGPLPRAVERRDGVLDGEAKVRRVCEVEERKAQINELYCKFLCHNICVLISSIYELGIAPEFWKQETA